MGVHPPTAKVTLCAGSQEQGHGELLLDHGASERTRSSPDPETPNFSQLCP